MLTCLLKRVLPFTLTFIIGATVGGLFNLYRTRTVMWTLPENATPLLGHDGPFGETLREGRGCRAYRRNLVAETKPLVILFKPDAVLPHEFHENAWKVDPVFVNVTFGADGKVQKVERVSRSFIYYKSADLVNISETVEKAAEKAARQIQFMPEMVNGMPVSVTREVEIRFIND